jgi:hypothetical protein
MTVVLILIVIALIGISVLLTSEVNDETYRKR